MVIKTISTDGTGDYNVTGTNDELLINKAISDVSLLSSPTSLGVIHFKPGIYKILSTVRLLSNVILEGEGVSSVIQAQPGINSARVGFYHMIGVSGPNNEMRNLVVDGNNMKVGLGGGYGLLNGIQFWGANDNQYFHDITVKNMPDDGLVGNANNTTIQNVGFESTWHSALRLGGGNAMTSNYNINNIMIRDRIGNAGIRMGAKITGATIRNVRITSVANFAIEIDTNSTYDDINNIIFENIEYIVDPQRSGICAIALFNSDTSNRIWHINGITFKNIIIDQKGLGTIGGGLTPAPVTVFIKDANNIAFENTTIYNAYGDAVRVQNDNLLNQNCNINIKNSILNRGPRYGISGGNYINWNIMYNDIYGFSLGNFQGSAIGNLTNISADPMFVNPVAQDFHLQVTSPAIGTGENGVNMGANPDLFGVNCPPPSFNYIISQV